VKENEAGKEKQNLKKSGLRIPDILMKIVIDCRQQYYQLTILKVRC